MKKVILMLAMVLPMLATAQKIAHINSQELLMSMPEIKTMQAQLDTLANQYELQYANMQEEFTKKVADFQAAQATMTDGVKQFRQQELADMEQRIQLFAQTAQKDLQTKQQEYMRPIQEKAMAAIKKVGAAQGCTYVFDSMSTVYISDDALDLMDLVKKELNIK